MHLKGGLLMSAGVVWESSFGRNRGHGHRVTHGVRSIGSLPDHEILERVLRCDAFNGWRTDHQVISFYSGVSHLIFADPCGVSGNSDMMNHSLPSQGVATSVCKGVSEQHRLFFGVGTSCAVCADLAIRPGQNRAHVAVSRIRY